MKSRRIDRIVLVYIVGVMVTCAALVLRFAR